MTQQEFGGDKKVELNSPLYPLEKRIVKYLTPKFPRWIEGYHLTSLTIPWSAGLILFGYLAKQNINWLWLSSLMLFLQWFTDSFDGALGRYRDTGIPRWGFYMDHFLDYIFMFSLIIGYIFIVPQSSRITIFILIPIFGAFMVSSFLAFAATNEFKITFLGVGPTEVRVVFIIINTLLILFGTTYFILSLPYVMVISFIMLCVVVYRSHLYIWNLDKEEKRVRDNASPLHTDDTDKAD